MNNFILRSFSAAALLLLLWSVPVLCQTTQQNTMLNFTANRGQVIDQAGNKRPDIAFIAQSAGAQLFFRDNGISYVFAQLQKVYKHDSPALMGKYATSLGNLDVEQSRILIHRLDMELIGSLAKPLIEGHEASEGYSNYYYAHCPEGILEAGSYAQVMYREVYKGIDLVFYGTPGGMKYDFIVRAGANASQIRLRYVGAERVELHEGRLRISTPLGSVEEGIPYSYQSGGGNTAVMGIHKRKVRSSYRVEGREVSFDVGEYDHSQTLIIDPGILWSTCYGAMVGDEATGVAVDGSNNTLMTGTTVSATFPVTPGAFQSSLAPTTASVQMDAYVVKFDSRGKRLWATFYGGSGPDNSYGIVADKLDNVMIAGNTESRNFPVDTTVAVVQKKMYSTSSQDAFVVKLNKSGARHWATFYGGEDGESVYGIALDHPQKSQENIVLVGFTTSDYGTFPPGGEGGGIQHGIHGIVNAFIAKFNPAGQQLWFTYYGGSKVDYATSVAVDDSNFVLVTGVTSSLNFPVTPGVMQPNFGGGTSLSVTDAFVVKIDSIGNKVSWSTYLGGTGEDVAYGIAADKAGSAVVVGQTGGDFPTSSSALQKIYGGNDCDGFATKLSNTGQMLWSTYIGGGGPPGQTNVIMDIASAVAIDHPTGRIGVVGWTNTTTANAIIKFPITQNALRKTNIGDVDAFFMLFDSGGDTLLSTYYGGFEPDSTILHFWDEAHAVAFDNTGNLVVVGRTTSANFSVKQYNPQTYQQPHVGLADAFIVKYGCDVEMNVSFSPSLSVCAGDSVTLDAGTGFSSYLWSNNATSQSITVKTSGSFTVTVSDKLNCIKTSTSVSVLVRPKITPVILSSTPTVFCAGDSVRLMLTQPYSSVLWSTGEKTSSIVVSKPGKYHATVTDEFGCTATSKDTSIIIHELPALSMSKSSIDFGILDGCQSSKDQTISISNDGKESAEFSVEFTDSRFSLLPAIPSSFKLAVGAKQVLYLRFTPAGTGAVSGSMQIKAGPCQKEYSIALSADKSSALVQTSLTSVIFAAEYGCALLPQDTVMLLYNKGSESIEIGTAESVAPFSVESSLPASIKAGDSLALKLSYTPVGVGSYSGVVRIPYKAGSCQDTIPIGVQGLVHEVRMEPSPGSVVFAALLGCQSQSDTTIMLHNRGSVGLHVVQVGSQANFSVVSGVPVDIKPGDSAEVKVRFAGSTSESSEIELSYGAGGCNESVKIGVSGSKQGVSVEVADTVDFAEVYACQQKSVSKSVSISNTSEGEIEAEVVRVDVQGSFSTSLKPGEKIASKGSKSFDVTFTPESDGKVSGSIEIHLEPCGIVRRIELVGSRAVVSLTGKGSENFGSVQEGTVVSRELKYTNNGSGVLHIEKLEIGPGVFKIMGSEPPVPLDLGVGEELKIEVEYSSEVGVQAGEMRVIESLPCTDTVRTGLQGEGLAKPGVGSGSALLSIGDLRASVEQKNFHIPIVLKSQRNLAALGVRKLRAEVRVNWTMFAGSVGGNIKGVHQESEEEVIELETEVGPEVLSTGSTVSELVGDVLLGNAVRTSIEIGKVEWLSGTGGSVDVSSSSESGSLSVEGLCEQGSVRLLNYREGFGILSISPNPSGGSIEVAVAVVEESRTSIEIYNLYGERVYAYEWQAQPGSKTLRIEAHLSDGFYQILLRSPARSASAQLSVIR